MASSSADAELQEIKSLLQQNKLGLQRVIQLDKDIAAFENSVSGDAALLQSGSALPIDAAGAVGAPGSVPDNLDTTTKSFEPLHTLAPKTLLGGTTVYNGVRGKDDFVAVQGTGYLYSVRHCVDATLRGNVRTPDFVLADGGDDFSVALASNGMLFSWGTNNEHGQLGYMGHPHSIPKLCKALYKITFVNISCGAEHVLASTDNGICWSWGQNNHGQCGQELIRGDNVKQISSPAAISALVSTPVQVVSAGDWHSAVISSSSGDLFVFGKGSDGALGISQSFDVFVPQKVQYFVDRGVQLERVASGAAHSIVQAVNGFVYAWGANDRGQLGVDHTRNLQQPHEVVSLRGSKISSISCGHEHTMVLIGREVRTFGRGTEGQLGHANFKDQLAPRRLTFFKPEIRARAAYCAKHYSVVLTDYGDMFYFGNVRHRSKTIDTPLISNVPRPFRNLDKAYFAGCGGQEITLIIRQTQRPPKRHIIRNESGMQSVEEDSVASGTLVGRVYTFGQHKSGQLGHPDVKAPLSAPFVVELMCHTSVLKITCGHDFSSCVSDEGRLYCWGGNRFGQLGTGDTKSRPVPNYLIWCREPLHPRSKHMANKRFVNVQAGKWFVMAITNKGKVYSWGKNKYGQLGHGSLDNALFPTMVEALQGKDVRDFACGATHCLCLTGDGEVLAWGRNWTGCLGLGDERSRTKPETVKALSGLAVSWVSAGWGHSAVVTGTGILMTFGLNDNGQLGTGNTIGFNSPVRVALEDGVQFKVVECGAKHTVALSLAGAVYGFGRNHLKQLGTSEFRPAVLEPTRLQAAQSIQGITTISAGESCTSIIGGDGYLRVIGFIEGAGKLSGGQPAGSQITLQLRSRASRAGTTVSVPGSAVCFGFQHAVVLGFDEDSDRVFYNRARLKEIESIKITNSELKGLSKKVKKSYKPILAVSRDYQHGGEPITSFQQADSEHDAFGQPLLGTQSSRLGSMVGSKTRTQSSASQMLTSVGESIDQDGSETEDMLNNGGSDAEDVGEIAEYFGVAIMWGSNDSMQLGKLGLAASNEEHEEELVEKASSKPMKTPKGKSGCPPCAMYGVIGMTSVVQIACGSEHTVCITESGETWVWGNNSYGQLGTLDFETREEPVLLRSLPGKTMVKACAGVFHTLLLSDAAKVFTFGSNSDGQLGLGHKQAKVNVPDIVHKLRRTRIVKLAAGRAHSVASTFDGKMFTWGSNSDGQLGLGKKESFAEPQAVADVADIHIDGVAAGFDHTLAFSKTGSLVYSWGLNHQGQLGHADYFPRDSPKVISVLQNRAIKEIFAGADMSAALDTLGRLYTWGDSQYGQLGNGDDVRSSVPQIPSRLADVKLETVDFGKGHAIASTKNHQILSWGRNDYGQLGLPHRNSTIGKRKKTNSLVFQPDRWTINTVKDSAAPSSRAKVRAISCGRRHSAALIMVSAEMAPKSIEAIVANLEKHARGELMDDDEAIEEDAGADAADENVDKDEDQIVAEMAAVKSSEQDSITLPQTDSGAEWIDEWTGLLAEQKMAFPKDCSAEPFITRIGLPHLAKIFARSRISLHHLIELSNDDLVELGINTVGARKRILLSAQRLKESPETDQLPADVSLNEMEIVPEASVLDGLLSGRELGMTGRDAAAVAQEAANLVGNATNIGAQGAQKLASGLFGLVQGASKAAGDAVQAAGNTIGQHTSRNTVSSSSSIAQRTPAASVASTHARTTFSLPEYPAPIDATMQRQTETQPGAARVQPHGEAVPVAYSQDSRLHESLQSVHAPIRIGVPNNSAVPQSWQPQNHPHSAESLEIPTAALSDPYGVQFQQYPVAAMPNYSQLPPEPLGSAVAQVNPSMRSETGQQINLSMSHARNILPSAGSAPILPEAGSGPLQQRQSNSVSKYELASSNRAAFAQ